MSYNYFEIVVYFEINPITVSTEVLNHKFAFEITDIYEVFMRVLSYDKVCEYTLQMALLSSLGLAESVS